MQITDADIERAIRKHAAALDRVPDIHIPFDPDGDEGFDPADGTILH